MECYVGLDVSLKQVERWGVKGLWQVWQGAHGCTRPHDALILGLENGRTV